MFNHRDYGIGMIAWVFSNLFSNHKQTVMHKYGTGRAIRSDCSAIGPRGICAEFKNFVYWFFL